MPPHKPPYIPMPIPPMNVVNATVFRDPKEGGAKVALGLTGSQRYDLRRFSDLAPDALIFSASSASVSRSRVNDSESSLYLFSGNSLFGPADYRLQIPQALLVMRVGSPWIDFHGDFLQITLPGGPAGSFSFDDLSTAGFNDKTTSVMLVNRWRNGAREETVSAAATFTAPWNFAFEGIIPVIQFFLGGGVAIAKVQDPVFSWIAFPPPNQNLATNFTYMVVSQWFVFNSWGIGVNAWLQFYLRLGLDEDHKLQVNIVDMDFYVWPGTGQGQLMDALSGAKNSIISTLQTTSFIVAAIVENLPGTTCDDVYLLPGTQPDTKATTNGSAKGISLSDVTIVFENLR
jgi:hypothetical protein